MTVKGGCDAKNTDVKASVARIMEVNKKWGVYYNTVIVFYMIVYIMRMVATPAY
jgi:hypothetical protein